jgi:hypothetical protein
LLACVFSWFNLSLLSFQDNNNNNINYLNKKIIFFIFIISYNFILCFYLQVLFCDLSLRISFCIHLRTNRLVHNLKVIATMDPNSSNVLRDIQEQLQLMRKEISNMSNQMNNLSGRIESIETL